MERMDHGNHICTHCERLEVLLPVVELDNFRDLFEGRLVPMRRYEIDQPFPTLRTQRAQFTDILLILPFCGEGDGDDV